MGMKKLNDRAKACRRLTNIVHALEEDKRMEDPCCHRSIDLAIACADNAAAQEFRKALREARNLPRAAQRKFFAAGISKNAIYVGCRRHRALTIALHTYIAKL
jgi:hypothetical protein